MEIRNEAFSSVVATATTQALVLHEKKTAYTLLHTGLNAAKAADVNPIYLSVAPEVPDGAAGLNKMVLSAGMIIEVGVDNGDLSIAFKSIAGAPVLAVLSGILSRS